MIEGFVSDKYTYKNEDKNFIEWHKGRKRYAVWVIEIENKEWLDNLSGARDLLEEYLLQGQHRVAHITLFACGFFDDCAELIEKQSLKLKKKQLKSFFLDLSRLDSFLSAPYFSISDLSNAISKARHVLEEIMPEDRSEVYHPHLTVGLYNDAYCTSLLSEKINSYEMLPADKILVKKISLMTFDTNSVFSPLCAEFEIELEH